MTENRIGPEDFDSTTSALNEGVRSLAIERAVSEVNGCQKKLEASRDPGLQPIADNLGQLKELLTAETLDAGAIGRLLVELGDRTQAGSGTACSRQAAAAEPTAHRRGALRRRRGRALHHGRGGPGGR